MNITTITQPNTKGQIVIPKKIRDFLGIHKNSFLKLVSSENGLHIYPVEPVHSKPLNKNAYLRLLGKTRGKWVAITKQEIQGERKRKELELTSSKRAQNAW